MGSSPPLPHIAIFPFLSKGHTIPLIHLAHLISRRRLARLTFFTTPLNAHFLRNSLADTDTNAQVVELPFPHNLPNLPNGVESTDALPSISLFLPFVHATELLQPHFERTIPTLPAVTFLISDGFLGWTNASAAKFGIPRVAFSGMGSFAMTVSSVVATEKPHADAKTLYEPFAVPGFPGLHLTRADLNPPFDDPTATGPMHEFVAEQGAATQRSRGLVVNSFYELEREYNDKWKGPKAWCVGPVCLARPNRPPRGKLMSWLDAKSSANRPVLYVAFGTQADMSAEQIKEIAAGLESSGVDFLWVVRDGKADIGEGYEERVGERGRVVREWVEQVEILGHGSVEGFVSHCGWNSLMESVCAAVPVLAWPLIAEQHLNAKLAVDVLGIGLRVRASDRTKHGLVRAEEIAAMAKELLSGEKGRAARAKVGVLADAARCAVADGGPSAAALEEMIEEVSSERITVSQNGF